MSIIRHLERELAEKEQELLQHRRHAAMISDTNTTIAKLKSENEQLMEALHKEQDKSYKLLRDLHQQMQETKGLKQVVEEQKVEIDQARIERHKHHEIQADNDRLRAEIQGMSKYIQELESGMEQHRERIRETEKAVGQQLEQHRILEAGLEKLRHENDGAKRSIQAANERLAQTESQLQYQVKENEDLKHDNTVLY